MSYLDMAEFVDDDIVKTGQRRLDQVEVERDSPGSVGIAAPARFHGADGDRWQRDSFCMHHAVAFN